MFHLTPFAVSGLFIALTYFPLFLLISFKGKNQIARLYSFHIFFAFLWGVGSFFIGSLHEPKVVVIVWKFAYSAVLFVPVFFQHAVLLQVDNRNRTYLYLIYAQAIFFTFGIFTNQLMAEVRLFSNSFYYHVATKMFLASSVIWVGIVVIAHVQLFLYYRRCRVEQKGQIRALFLAVLGFTAGLTNFLPPLNIDIYPYGNFFVPIHAFIITYAIFKYQLLDLKVEIRKRMAYSFAAALMTTFYLIFVLVFEKFIQQAVGYRSYIFSAFVAFVVGLLFFPFARKINQVIDHFFFKATPEELSEQNELLRREVADKEKFKAVATLASGIAHEVRNPLTAIKTYFEYFPQKKDDPKFLENYNRIASKEIDRIESLVQKLLDFSKPSPPNLQKVHIHKIIEDVLSLLEAKARENKIQIVSHFVSSDVILQADANQIKQALLNILQNGIEALREGGELTVKTEISDKSVSREASFVKREASQSLPIANDERRETNDSARLFISIKDNGQGIPKDKLPHIFDAFYTSKDSGTGLGLAITQSIIEEHGGKITVKSIINHGTTFTIDLPIKPIS